MRGLGPANAEQFRSGPDASVRCGRPQPSPDLSLKQGEGSCLLIDPDCGAKRRIEFVNPLRRQGADEIGQSGFFDAHEAVALNSAFALQALGGADGTCVEKSCCSEKTGAHTTVEKLESMSACRLTTMKTRAVCP